jgi:hypothetical protein
MSHSHQEFTAFAEVIPSRRQFLQRIGLASSVLGFGIFGGLALPEATAQCNPPGNPGTPRPWRRDCRGIRPRRPASTLSAAEVKKLKDAYAAMRALDTSDPNDPRGFLHQSKVHCFFCGHGLQIHGSWQFFPWHRAYLYFHERILGTLIGDPEFRLPYWDWDRPASRKLPPAYATPNDATNPLWNGTRAMDPTDEIPASDVDDTVMENALTASTFGEFGGTAINSGIPEGSPHGSVHVDVGGDMGTFQTAALDPVFYAHHSNVDKMWSDWNKASATHTNPTDAPFLNLSWSFFDENKVWRSITAAHVLNHENQLRYTYGPSQFIEKLPCLLDWISIRTDWSLKRQLKLSVASQNKFSQVFEQGGRVRMHLDALSVPLTKSAMYNLYTSPEAAKADEGPGHKEYLGSFPVVLNDRENRHKRKPVTDVVLSVSKETFQNLASISAPLKLAFIERGANAEARTPILASAKSLRFSSAEMEH